ncbi:hypothetical protein [Martelella sp. HB161492]|uniref:hypothetical protein n=1 Tax=Martelella sp. HB161492 TaxID=2720726 RepID=UPI00158FD64C|nr:hypothetical protein [Martelella sp. HB161492]
MQRLLGARACDGLRETTRRSVVQGGGPERFQYVTRVNQGQLSKYWTFDPDRRSQLFMPIDIAIEADMEAGAPIIVGEMARQLGYRLVRDEDVAGPSGELGHEDLLAFEEAAHRVIQTVLRSVADGHVDRGEGADILEKVALLLRYAGILQQKAESARRGAGTGEE